VEESPTLLRDSSMANGEVQELRFTIIKKRINEEELMIKN